MSVVRCTQCKQATESETAIVLFVLGPTIPIGDTGASQFLRRPVAWWCSPECYIAACKAREAAQAEAEREASEKGGTAG